MLSLVSPANASTEQNAQEEDKSSWRSRRPTRVFLLFNAGAGGVASGVGVSVGVAFELSREERKGPVSASENCCCRNARKASSGCVSMMRIRVEGLEVFEPVAAPLPRIAHALPRGDGSSESKSESGAESEAEAEMHFSPRRMGWIGAEAVTKSSSSWILDMMLKVWIPAPKESSSLLVLGPWFLVLGSCHHESPPLPSQNKVNRDHDHRECQEPDLATHVTMTQACI